MSQRDQGHGRNRVEKFTTRARKVLSLAQEEAIRFRYHYVGTEHVLLGLLREGDGIAAKVLVSLGVQLQQMRAVVEHNIRRGDHVVFGNIELTPRAQRVVELAVDEARRLNHPNVGTEHILLGLIREGGGIAAGMLESQGLALEQVRMETLKALKPNSE